MMMFHTHCMLSQNLLCNNIKTNVLNAFAHLGFYYVLNIISVELGEYFCSVCYNKLCYAVVMQVVVDPLQRPQADHFTGSLLQIHVLASGGAPLVAAGALSVLTATQQARRCTFCTDSNGSRAACM